MHSIKEKRHFFILLIIPLLVYETAFTLYVIYYTHPIATWFYLSYSGIFGATLISMWLVRRTVLTWNRKPKGQRKKETVCLLFGHLALVCYILSLVVQASDTMTPYPRESNLMIVLTGIPPVAAFLAYLLTDVLPPAEKSL